MLTTSELSGVFWAFLVNLICWGAVAFICVSRLRLPIYHPVTLLLIYHLFGFVIRPVVLLATGYSELWERIGIVPDSHGLAWATATTNLALFSFMFGAYFAARSTAAVDVIQPFRIELADGHQTVFWIKFILLSLAALYGTSAAFGGAGTSAILAYETSFDSRGAMTLVGVSGYQTALSEFAPILLLVLLMNPAWRRLGVMLLIGFVLYRMYVGSQRLAFIATLIGAYFYYLISVGRRYPRLIHLVGFVMMLSIFDFIGGDRLAIRKVLSGEQNLAVAVAEYRQNRSHNAMVSDVSEFDVSAATVTALQGASDYSYGSQYIRLLIWPIPRQLWPDKPVFTNSVDLNRYGDFRYLTTGLYADLFMVFGLPSVLIGMVLFGWLAIRLYIKASEMVDTAPLLFFFVVLMYFKTIVRDGGVTVVYFWIFSCIPLIVLAGNIRVLRYPARG